MLDIIIKGGCGQFLAFLIVESLTRKIRGKKKKKRKKLDKSPHEGIKFSDREHPNPSLMAKAFAYAHPHLSLLTTEE